MTKDDCEVWLAELIAQAAGFVAKEGGFGGLHYDDLSVTRFLGEALTVMESALPARHPLLRQWNEVPKGSQSGYIDRRATILAAALSMLKNGRLGSLLDGIRTETESEVLDQADHLVAKGYLVAAAVLAGGALETHLHFLCSKHSLTWDGHGSIGKYDGAIAQARKQGNEVYSATDSKQITAWGGMRNDAAHKPTEFSGPKERVSLVVDGIRGFIARVS